MRIILKPAGAISVALMFILLVGLVLWERSRIRVSAEAGAVAAVAVAPAQQASSSSASAPTAPALRYPWRYVTPTVTVQDPGFESDFAAVQPYDTIGQISGQIAGHWYDDSSWSTATAVYAPDRSAPHGGSACQKITVSRNDMSGFQLVNYLRLTPGRKYTGGFWLRADHPVNVQVVLRQAGSPFDVYSATNAVLNSTWQRVTTTGTIGADARIYLMLKIQSLGTVWVDDATLVPAG